MTERSPAPPAPLPAPEPAPQVAPQELPRTGTESTPLLFGAMCALLAGSLLLLAGRRED